MADMDALYVCSLSEASKKKAKFELNEDPKNRLGAVQTLRKWLEEQPHIQCPMDTIFLLSILRTRKFSQLASRELVQKYLERRQKFSVWFLNCNLNDPKRQAVIESGVFLLLPGVDDHGQKVVMLRSGFFNLINVHFSKEDLFRTFCGLLDYNHLSEEVQVNGLVMVLDFSDTTLKTHMKVPIEDRKNFIQSFQRYYPSRTKGVHLYNAGVFMDILLSLIKVAMTEKIQKRVVNHSSNLEGLYDHIPLRLLPEEYLPDDYTGPTNGSTKDIIAQMWRDLNTAEVLKMLKDRSNSQYGIFEAKRSKDSAPVASFRKLNLD